MAKETSLRVRKVSTKDLAALISLLERRLGEIGACAAVMKALEIPSVEFDGGGRALRGAELIADFAISLEAAIKREKNRLGK